MYPRVSYTALARFEECSTKQRLQVEKKSKPIPVEHVTVGNALHYGLAIHIDTYGAVPVAQAALWEFQRRCAEKKPRWTREKFLEQVERVRTGSEEVERLVGQTWGWDPRLHSEVRLMRAYRGWAIDGFVDLMVNTGEEIWDLKTGQWHADQMVFYDVLAEAVLGKQPISVGVIEPFGRGMIAVEISEEHRVDIKKRIKVFVERVAADDWQFEGYRDRCSWCPSQAYCPKFDLARSGSLEA